MNISNDHFIREYNYWLEDDLFDIETKAELTELDIYSETGIREIEDRFYKEIEFGTGGLRGVMGAGINRVNIYTIGRISKGLADYLTNKYSINECLSRGVAIAYDTRNNSKCFASTAANVLSASGIKVYLFDQPAPTPLLSFAVAHKNCIAGIVITASHNPKEYNGYKIYDDTGCQLVPHQSNLVKQYIDRIKYDCIPFNTISSLIEHINVTEEYISTILKNIPSSTLTFNDCSINNHLSIVYTPLHGTGLIPFIKTLETAGFEHITIVKEQQTPDGDFPTVKVPNPEEAQTLEMGISLAQKIDADIVLATDPDADRIGLAIKTTDTASKNPNYQLLTGNQIGALIVDYVLSNTDLSNVVKPAVVKTVVTSQLGAKIAEGFGCEVFNTLTGFKYIGEMINKFEESEFSFIAGYEESYGYLIGTHARDKDAIISGLIICQMAAEYKAKGLTLLDRLKELYSLYGYYAEELESFSFEGKEGFNKMNEIMSNLKSSISLDTITDILDFNEIGFKHKELEGVTEKSNLVKFILKDNSWFAVRPSGTEPKIKIYYSIVGKTASDADDKLASVKTAIRNKFGL